MSICRKTIFFFVPARFELSNFLLFFTCFSAISTTTKKNVPFIKIPSFDSDLEIDWMFVLSLMANDKGIKMRLWVYFFNFCQKNQGCEKKKQQFYISSRFNFEFQKSIFIWNLLKFMTNWFSEMCKTCGREKKFLYKDVLQIFPF